MTSFSGQKQSLRTTQILDSREAHPEINMEAARPHTLAWRILSSHARLGGIRSGLLCDTCWTPTTSPTSASSRAQGRPGLTSFPLP